MSWKIVSVSQPCFVILGDPFLRPWSHDSNRSVLLVAWWAISIKLTQPTMIIPMFLGCLFILLEFVLSVNWNKTFFVRLNKTFSAQRNITPLSWNPAPVGRYFIPLFTGFYTSQVVQDFFHQQDHQKITLFEKGTSSEPWTIESWLANRDPYNVLLWFPYINGSCNSLYTENNQVLLIWTIIFDFGDQKISIFPMAFLPPKILSIGAKLGDQSAFFNVIKWANHFCWLVVEIPLFIGVSYMSGGARGVYQIWC